MPEFAELQQYAINFPENLVKIYTKQCSTGSLFCACLPPVANTQQFTDALLIQHIARGVDYYSEASIETKELVLIGIFVYTWYQYGSNLQGFLNKPLLSLFQKILEIDSLAKLDRTIYENSLRELSNFSDWVYDNREYRELEPLYEVLPAEMQGNIHTQRNTHPSDSSPWSSLSGLMTQVGIKNLF